MSRYDDRCAYPGCGQSRGGHAVTEAGHKFVEEAMSAMDSREAVDKLNQANIERALAQVVNSYSLENGSDTPDFILAAFLSDCLTALNRLTVWRSKWYSPHGVPSHERHTGPKPPFAMSGECHDYATIGKRHMSPHGVTAAPIPDEPQKCDGDHAEPRCNDPYCWLTPAGVWPNIDPPSPSPSVESQPEIGSDVPERIWEEFGLGRTAEASVQPPTESAQAGGESETKKVRLAECPPGLFLWNETCLGFRSEYGCDAYVVASGEFFWGGASTREDRTDLLVLPLPMPSVSTLPVEAPTTQAAAPDFEKLWQRSIDDNASRMIVGSEVRQVIGAYRTALQSIAALEGRVKELQEDINLMHELDASKLPCGHFNRYGVTSDGGKTGYCALCEIQTLREDKGTAESSLAAKDKENLLFRESAASREKYIEQLKAEITTVIIERDEAIRQCGLHVAVEQHLHGEVAAKDSELAGLRGERVKEMVERFLQWRLPENWHPDAGISFKAAYNEHTPHPMKHEPVGTNLFDVVQAEAMIRYMFGEEA